jgi:hypothetical protein
MKRREFNKILNSCRKKVGKDKALLDTAKIDALPEETRHKVALFIVSKRAPLVENFITPLMDQSWLNCVGYMSKTKGKDFTFIHASEHQIK